MPLNAEMKARITNRKDALARLKQLTGGSGTKLLQEDTFYRVKKGRLKLRCDQNSNQCEVIYYRRANEPDIRISSYYRRPVQDVAAKRKELEEMFGESARVTKERTVFLIDDIRVHLDEVEGLGDYLEIEVPVTARRSAHAAKFTARQLLRQLSVTELDPVSSSYADLAGS